MRVLTKATVPCGTVLTVREVLRGSLGGADLVVDGDPPGGGVVPGGDVMPLDRALNHFAEALRRGPNDAEVLRAQARGWAALGEHDRERADRLEADRIAQQQASASAEEEDDEDFGSHIQDDRADWLEYASDG